MLIVKIGGGTGTQLDPAVEDLTEILRGGTRLVLVHGASGETNLLAEKLGKPPHFVTSVSGIESRYTDRETLEIFEMAYCGKINKAVVESFQRRGVNAVGLSGLDGRIFEGKRKDTLTILEGSKRKVLRGDYTGKVERVNVGLVTLLLDHGYLPVLCPPAVSYQGEAVNVDGDTAAAELAAALKAAELVLLSNVAGLLRDLNDSASLVARIPAKAIDDFMPLAHGRMKRKLMAAAIALRGGVNRVVLGSANTEKPVSSALAGQGTVIQ
jgi:acetylglutamate/LysW-gamma-L-alpha-aminoadipate kinase